LSISEYGLRDRQRILRSDSGFTLIEVIVSLVLIGIMSAVVGGGLVYVVQGFIFTKMNVATLQKGQVAMSRISMELKNISVVSGFSTATALTFDSYKDGVNKTRKISWNGGDTIEIDDGDGVFHTLTDQTATTNGLKFMYYAMDESGHTTECSDKSEANIVEVTLRMAGADGSVLKLTERITPRNG